MKKLIFSLFAFLSVTSLCFAQQAQAPVKKLTVSQTAQAPVENKLLTGTVDSVIVEDVVSGVKSGLVVVDDAGQKLSFVVASDTSITGQDSKTIVLGDLKKDNKVSVTYTMDEMGAHQAQSIKLVE